MSDQSSSASNPTRLLEAVTKALAALLEPMDFEFAVEDALAGVGEAAELDYLFIIDPLGEGAGLQIRWSRAWAGRRAPARWDPARSPLVFCQAFSFGFDQLRAGQTICSSRDELPDVAEAFLAPLGVISWMLTPLILHGEFWGFVGATAGGRERIWNEAELFCWKAFVTGLAGALLRQEVVTTSATQARELQRHQRVALSLAEDARLSARAAAQASLAKSTFLAMMSHEIRTPLNGVIGFTDLLLAEGLPGHQSELAQGIRTCGEALLSLITDILDISKIESGRLDLNPANADVAGCARSVLAAFEPTARQNGLELELFVDASVPPELCLDLNYFRQILFNLVGNAVKFTDRGRVEVRLWVEKSAEEQTQLFGRVSDTGAGISPEDLQMIFEPFQQGKNAQMEAVGGSGLGLAICGRLIAAMGGQIDVQSTPGKGSQFSFYIDVQEARPSAPGSISPFGGAIGNADTPLAVLVVDDVPTNVRLAVSMLKRFGFHPDSATTGAQALCMLAERPYELIFMDILMPEMDGYETVRRIRSRDEAPGLIRPWVVAITADALPENRRKCAEVGMDDFLTKPLRISDMDQALARWKGGVAALQK